MISLGDWPGLGDTPARAGWVVLTLVACVASSMASCTASLYRPLTLLLIWF